MKRVALFLAVSIGLLACDSSNRPATTQQADQATDTTKNALNGLTIQLEESVQLDTSYVLLPLGMSETAKDEGLIETRKYKEVGSDTYWNVAFYHIQTHRYHLLDANRKMIIQQIYPTDAYTNKEEAHSSSPKHIFYNIITTDFNGDKRFTFDDASYLFVSDRTGRNFRQLSPDNQDLISWKIMKGTTKVMMLVRNDSDGNKKFEQEDEKRAFIVNLDDTLKAREVFGTEDKTKLKKLFDRDWKRKR